MTTPRNTGSQTMCESVCIFMTFTVFLLYISFTHSVCLSVCLSLCVCVWAMLRDSNKMMMMMMMMINDTLLQENVINYQYSVHATIVPLNRKLKYCEVATVKYRSNY